MIYMIFNIRSRGVFINHRYMDLGEKLPDPSLNMQIRLGCQNGVLKNCPTTSKVKVVGQFEKL